MAAKGRILIIVTNAGEFRSAGFRTGLWLSELTHFWDVAEEAGYSMTLASPSGGVVPLDPESLIMTGIADRIRLGGSVQRRYRDRAFMDRLQDTPKISSIDPADFDAIYMTGGHGVMFDFPGNEALAQLTAQFFENGKVVAAVCHGLSGLLDVRLSNGNHLVSGRKVTGFSWREEIAARRDDVVPFNLEEELKKRGASFSKALLPFAAHVVEDGLLITGQNPRSARGVGKAVVDRLAANR